MKAADLQAAMDDLRSTLPPLNEACDEATECIRTLDRFFGEAGLGMRLRAGPVEIGGRFASLEYGRRHGVWCILVRVETGRAAEMTQVDLWEDCDRETRLRTFTLVPALVAEAVARVDVMKALAEGLKLMPKAPGHDGGLTDEQWKYAEACAAFASINADKPATS